MNAKTKNRVFWIAILALFGSVAGLLVLLSGVVPIKASSGHWAITEYVLQLGKRRSVATHTLFTKVPELDDPALVLRGAGHFDGGCRPCHGAPDLPRPPRVAQAMLPVPPPLAESAAKWEPAELFYIVKHGIKFTGMPAWPARGRDDEVWAVVAFMQKLPQLSGDDYVRLVRGEPNAIPLDDLVGAEQMPAAIETTCKRCHGVAGHGRGNAAFPAIAGQRLAYLRASLRAYAEGRRHSGIMETAISGLSNDELEAAARYYAGLPARRLRGGAPALAAAAPADPIDAAALARGRAIANDGIPHRKIPACVGCHGPAEIPDSDHVPILTGQYADYLVLQLQLFEQDARGGTGHAHLMDPVVRWLEDHEMRDVALYFATLPRATSTAGPP